jgi:hypothetical protein
MMIWSSLPQLRPWAVALETCRNSLVNRFLTGLAPKDCKGHAKQFNPPSCANRTQSGNHSGALPDARKMPYRNTTLRHFSKAASFAFAIGGGCDGGIE